MKAIIENSVRNNEVSAYKNSNYIASLFEFNLILSRITATESEEQLRSSMKLDEYRHFKFGFGGNHMWVKQIINGEPKQQVIFVQF